MDGIFVDLILFITERRKSCVNLNLCRYTEVSFYQMLLTHSLAFSTAHGIVTLNKLLSYLVCFEVYPQLEFL